MKNLKFALVIFVLGSVLSISSCKKSNSDPDPEPTQTLDKIRGMWNLDSSNSDIYLGGQLVGSQPQQYPAGDFVDFFTDSEVAIQADGNVDSSTYDKYSDYKIAMYNVATSEQDTADILNLTDDVLILKFVTDTNVWGTQATIESSIYMHK